ncbi:MAG: hypothetical protein Q7S68_05660 [Deltaproteobacteria bacterium]|nr:hypothetical protein [Deltaproteobacteria bacterium]
MKQYLQALSCKGDWSRPIFNSTKGATDEFRDGVRYFYKNYLVGKFFPPDVEMIPVSQTIGSDQIADELVIKFTHTTPVEWMLPNIPPTGKRVEVAFVVIVKFENGKIAPPI